MTRDGRHLVAVATVANYAAIYSLPDFTLEGHRPGRRQPELGRMRPRGEVRLRLEPEG